MFINAQSANTKKPVSSAAPNAFKNALSVHKSTVQGSSAQIQNAVDLRHRVQFENIPVTLKRENRWVLSKAKKPFMARAIDAVADVSNPYTWSCFDLTQTSYEEGGYDGVGFVFNGDGIVGIDLDDCVVDGQPSDEAIEILHEIGCSYIELSQSGNGLHAYGMNEGVPLKGRRGIYKGIKTEVYCNGRFFVVTGNVWRHGDLPILNGLKSVYEKIETRSSYILTEETKAIASVCSVSSVQIPQACIPKQAGQRHHCIFELARYLRAAAPNANDEALKALLQRWWVVAEPNVRTKDFEESLIDFQHAWRNVKFPKGDVLAKILQDMPDDPPDNPGGFLGLTGRRIYHLCKLLDRQQNENYGNGVFMLSCRVAGNALRIDYRLANKVLKLFVEKKILEIAEEHTTVRATRYRLCSTNDH